MFMQAKSSKRIMWSSIAISLSIHIIGVYGNFNQDADWSKAQSFHDFHAVDLQGNDVSLDKYRGHVVVLFNGATRCPVSAKTFKLLQAMQEKYGESDGLRVVTFVIDGLVKESGTNQEVKDYIDSINVSFDVYQKIKSDGDDAHPVYKWIRSQLSEKIPPAAKILIDKDGQVIAKYPPTGPITEMENTMKQYF